MGARDGFRDLLLAICDAVCATLSFCEVDEVFDEGFSAVLVIGSLSLYRREAGLDLAGLLFEDRFFRSELWLVSRRLANDCGS